jgi:hypothetical protein
METRYRLAPPGFTSGQWDRFMRDGFLIVEDALSAADCERYAAAIDAIAAADPRYAPARHYSAQNAVEKHPDLVDMIDRETHIGYAYDLYGELTKVHLSNVMLRPHKTWRNYWHPDGARALPYQVFSPELPLQLKVAYWLTDLPREDMGNLVVLPGSHRHQILDAYDTHDDVPGQLPVCVKRGTMTLMHGSTWHKVNPNESSVVRKNVFMTYCPSWITPEDRYQNDPAWLATLNREQRILMRSYAHPYTNTKPPPEDFPLFLDRETGEDRDPDGYPEHVELHRRKRRTFHEKLATTTSA